MKRVFYGREYELEEGSDWCNGCAFEKGRRKCHGGGNPPPSKYCRPDHYDGVVLIWKEAGAKAEQGLAVRIKAEVEQSTALLGKARAKPC